MVRDLRDLFGSDRIVNNYFLPQARILLDEIQVDRVGLVNLLFNDVFEKAHPRKCVVPHNHRTACLGRFANMDILDRGHFGQFVQAFQQLCLMLGIVWFLQVKVNVVYKQLLRFFRLGGQRRYGGHSGQASLLQKLTSRFVFHDL
jgi:hypothetical protein